MVSSIEAVLQAFKYKKIIHYRIKRFWYAYRYQVIVLSSHSVNHNFCQIWTIITQNTLTSDLVGAPQKVIFEE